MFKRVVTAGIVALLVVLVGVQVFARDNGITKERIPPAVITAFEHAHPKATMKTFERKTWNNKVLYKIKYMEGTVKHVDKYTPDGELVASKEQVAPKDLPDAVTKAVNSKFPGAKVLRAEKVMHKGIVRYEVKLETSKNHKKRVFINEKGEILKKHHKK